MSRTGWPRLRDLGKSYYALVTFQLLESLSEWTTAALVTMWVLAGGFTGNLAPGLAILPIALATALPKLIAAPAAAWLADHQPWRRVLLAACAVRVVTLTGCAAASFAGVDGMTMLCVAIAVVTIQSTTGLLIEAARSAAVQIEIPEDARPEAASLSMFALTGIGVVSAAVAAWVYDAARLWSGLLWCIVITVAGVVVLAAAYRSPTTQPRAAANTVAGHALAAIRTLTSQPELRAVALSVAGYGLCLGAINYAMPLLIFGPLAATPGQYAAITAAFAIGGLVGAVITPAVVRRCGELPAFAAAAASLAATYVAIGAASRWQLTTAAMLACGLAFTVFATVQGPILQRVVPPGQMGAVMAALGPARSVAMLVGLLGAAAAVHALRNVDAVDASRLTYYVCAAVLLVVAATVWRLGKQTRDATVPG